MGKILFGLIFIFLDINFEGFDLLPNFIGFIFILLGLKNLQFKYPDFKKCKPIAIFLLLFGLVIMLQDISYYKYLVKISNFQCQSLDCPISKQINVFGTYLDMIFSFLTIIFYLIFFNAIKSSKISDKETTDSLFRALLLLVIFNITGSSIPLYFESAIIYQNISMIGALIVNFYMLYLINKIRKKLKN